MLRVARPIKQIRPSDLYLSFIIINSFVDDGIDRVLFSMGFSGAYANLVESLPTRRKPVKILALETFNSSLGVD